MATPEKRERTKITEGDIKDYKKWFNKFKNGKTITCQGKATTFHSYIDDGGRYCITVTSDWINKTREYNEETKSFYSMNNNKKTLGTSFEDVGALDGEAIRKDLDRFTACFPSPFTKAKEIFKTLFTKK